MPFQNNQQGNDNAQGKKICRSQGAMEYLMSYGWAILVVIIVGGVMWQLGIFEAQSGQASSTGFSNIKPILSTCEISEEAYYSGRLNPGFKCQFINGAGTDITIGEINVSLNNEFCVESSVSNMGSVVWVVPSNVGLRELTNWCDQWNCMIPTAYEYGVGGVNPPIIRFMSGETLIIAGYTDSSYSLLLPGNPCTEYSPGETYNVEIAITYMIDAGGITTTKREQGSIRIRG